MDLSSSKKTGADKFFDKPVKQALMFFRKMAGVFSGSNGSRSGQSRNLKNIDKKLVLSLSKSKVPNFKQFTYLSKYLSPRELLVLRIAVLLLVFSLVFTAVRLYQKHVEISPIQGGEYIEGLVGAPKYINPLFDSVNDVDGDISSLVFSSLFKRDSGGKLANDLVVNSEVSSDGKTYNFEIRTDAYWNNNDPLTSDDIIFTFNAIKDSEYKSPLNSVFAGVSIEKTGDNKIAFHLTEPYAGFMDLLTFGIISQKVWGEIPPEAALLAELNLKPIGSGLYRFKSLAKDKSGNLKTYKITANENYYGQKPYITDITFLFFPTIEEATAALNDNSINGISYLPVSQKNSLIAQDALNFHKLSIPQITAIFFNASKNPVLAEKKARQALAYAVNTDEVINGLGPDYYSRVYGPIPNGSDAQKKDIKKYDYNRDEALKLFKELGWERSEINAEAVSDAQATVDGGSGEDEKKNAQIILDMGTGNWLKKDGNYLLIALTTVDRPENQQVAEKIRQDWEAIGVKTRLDEVAVAQIQSNVLKTRDYEALFYGLTEGPDPDPYVFWHSSQIEKGSNLAGYSNKDADKLLEDARQTTDKTKRTELYYKFQDILAEDLPAHFLYQNTYVYVQSKIIKGYKTTVLYTPSNRFSDVADWYIKTGKKFKW